MAYVLEMWLGRNLTSRPWPGCKGRFLPVLMATLSEGRLARGTFGAGSKYDGRIRCDWAFASLPCRCAKPSFERGWLNLLRGEIYEELGCHHTPA